MMFIFFFKQKTAYELRISDWSSDVCSSDLHRGDQSERDIVVEADRRDDDFEPARDPAGDAIFDLAFALGRLRKGEEEPEDDGRHRDDRASAAQEDPSALPQAEQDRKSTRLNSSH